MRVRSGQIQVVFVLSLMNSGLHTKHTEPRHSWHPMWQGIQEPFVNEEGHLQDFPLDAKTYGAAHVLQNLNYLVAISKSQFIQLGKYEHDLQFPF